MTKLAIITLSIYSLFISPALAQQTVITEDTVWSGEVAISADVLIRKGATLSIQPGTTITISPCESTKTEPEYLSPLTEITVRGILLVNGTKDSPVSFVLPGQDKDEEWAGIYIDGGVLKLSHGRIQGAESALTVINGTAEISDSVISDNRHGLTVVARDKPLVTVKDTEITKNDYGIVQINDALISQENVQLHDNHKQDLLRSTEIGFQLPETVYTATKKDEDTEYNSESLLGTVIWKDKVTINGIVRIPPKSRLIIMPGTIVEFSKRDTNDDGIGENGLLVMGMLVAKGTEEQPIIFRSAEKEKNIGDWDAINIYTSDGFQNLIEYCQVENAYRAFHLHFSNVVINHSVIRNNYRGLQFQESLVEVSNTEIYANKSAMRARDSEVVFTDNLIYDNYLGPYIFRITGSFRGNTVAANYLDGLRVREGALQVSENYLTGNKYGLAVAYSVYGSFNRNVITDNIGVGIALKGTDSIEVAGNFIQGNGTNGISLLNSQGTIRANHISENNERGIGIISFNGLITENNLVNNKLYAIGLDGAGDVSAPGNWWGGADIEQAVYDHNDDPTKGHLTYSPARQDPVPYVWPLKAISDHTVWQGEFHIPKRLDLNTGASLRVAPGSTVKFGKNSSLWAFGNFYALGEPDNRIRFTALEKTDDITYWDQLTTERASARFANCDFENAYMAVHVHFSDVQITNCTFKKNESGVRFRGGPVDINQSLFEQNNYGIVTYLAKGHITDNIFTRNDIGILIRAERNGGIHIRGNNIFDNLRYNLRMGDFNPEEDVDARNNWWGKGDPRAKMFDDLNEPGIGLIFYEPFAKEAFKLKVGN